MGGWSRGPYRALPGRRDYPVIRWDVWLPILLATYPGYKLEDLLDCTFEELEFLIAGLNWVQRWRAKQDPMIDKKHRQRIRIPPFIDHAYPPKERGTWT